MSHDKRAEPPPLGIMPRALWEDRHWSEHRGPPTIEREAQRMVEVASAINRYVAAGLPPRIEWLKELRAITATIDNSRAASYRTAPAPPVIITSQAELDAAFGPGFGVFPSVAAVPVMLAMTPRKPPG